MVLDITSIECVKQWRAKRLLQCGTAIAPKVLMSDDTLQLHSEGESPLIHSWPDTTHVVESHICHRPACGVRLLSGGGDRAAGESGAAQRGRLYRLSRRMLAGYISHVPYMLSTLKLLKPQIGFGQHFSSLVETALESRFKRSDALVYCSSAMYGLSGTSLAFTLFRNIVIPLFWIDGSFVLVNGAIVLFNGAPLAAGRARP